MSDAWFDDLRAGQRFRTGGITLTESALVEFALNYDPQPIHVDAPAAAAGPYGGLIASGIQTLALACRLIQLTKPWAATSQGSPGIDDLRWLMPVRAGDTLCVETTIREARLSRSRPDRGVVVLDNRVLNQAGEAVMTFTVPEFVARRSDAGV